MREQWEIKKYDGGMEEETPRPDVVSEAGLLKRRFWLVSCRNIETGPVGYVNHNGACGS